MTVDVLLRAAQTLERISDLLENSPRASLRLRQEREPIRRAIEAVAVAQAALASAPSTAGTETHAPATWQDIASAPKDGTPVLVNFGDVGTHRVFWSESPFCAGIGAWCVTDGKFADRPLRGYVETDIHGWQPLPAPPLPVVRERQGEG